MIEADECIDFRVMKLEDNRVVGQALDRDNSNIVTESQIKPTKLAVFRPSRSSTMS